jgi:hypothetical protein
MRDIEKGEELTYDYSLADSNPNFSINCSCGSRDCRKTITGNDWKDDAFKMSNLESVGLLKCKESLPGIFASPNLINNLPS